ncbi:MAG: hypothetical protein SGI86_07210 [Deltaproteobacteria bacterium]|nr:hypothetical protein [Deltaproteobacteria bacterium]
MRVLSIAVMLSALVGFVGCIGVAMAVYPGGTWYDKATPGHHFWFNFLCDLLRQNGLNGRPNPLGSRLATVGMLSLVIAIAAYFWIAPEAMPRWPSVGRIVRITGLLGAAGLVSVALLPSDRFGKLHTFAIILAAGPGIIAVSLALAGVAFDPQAMAWHRLLGVSLWLSVVATAVLFVLHTFMGGGWIRALPAMQRVAAILAVTWMANAAVTLLQRLGRDTV